MTGNTKKTKLSSHFRNKLIFFYLRIIIIYDNLWMIYSKINGKMPLDSNLDDLMQSGEGR